ncbi:MAG: sterol carrier family protein [Pseudolysinimonas sp.]
MARARIAAEVGEPAVRAALEAAASGTAGDDRDTAALAARFLLQVLSDAAPGNTLEVRVPPFGAAQVVAGPRHTRGTPPNVVEMDAATWLELATGSLRWDEAIARHRVSASGSRADLTAYLPLAWWAGAGEG